jgi:hypothetical protein
MTTAELDVERDVLATAFENLASALRTAPEGIVFENQSFEGGHAVTLVLDPAVLDAARIRGLSDQYRTEAAKQTR